MAELSDSISIDEMHAQPSFEWRSGGRVIMPQNYRRVGGKVRRSNINVGLDLQKATILMTGVFRAIYTFLKKARSKDDDWIIKTGDRDPVCGRRTATKTSSGIWLNL